MKESEQEHKFTHRRVDAATAPSIVPKGVANSPFSIVGAPERKKPGPKPGTKRQPKQPAAKKGPRKAATKRDMPKVQPEAKRAPEPASQAVEPFRCWVDNSGAFTLTKNGAAVTLDRQEHAAMLAYLDRMGEPRAAA